MSVQFEGQLEHQKQTHQDTHPKRKGKGCFPPKKRVLIRLVISAFTDAE